MQMNCFNDLDFQLFRRKRLAASVGLACSSSIVLTALASAQVIPDQTLGSESSIVTPNTTMNGASVEQVTGGATRGSALFHSFSDFSVLSGQQVYFANPIGIDQIISRVTGNSLSNIFGTLGVDGGADLFFLNPNGIIFGPDAQIDVRGTFLASTADGFLFPDGLQYSARTPGVAPLLAMAVSPGLQYGSQVPGSIVNGAALAVGQDLILSGGSITSTGALFVPNGELTVEAVSGDVDIRQLAAQSSIVSASQDVLLTESQLWTIGDLQIQAGDNVLVRDTAEQPAQLAAGGNLLVQGDNAVDIFALNHSESGLFAWGDMVLRSPNPIGGDAHYWTGGNFRIETTSGELGQLFSPYDPIIRALGDVEFDAYIGTSLHILAAGSVTANFIVITAPETGATNIDYLEVPNPGLTLTLPGAPTTGAIDGSLQPTLDIRAGILPSAVGISPTIVFGSPISGYNGPFNIPSQTIDNFVSNFGGLIPPPSVTTATSADIEISDIAIAQPNGKVVLATAYEPNFALTGGSITLGEIGNPPIMSIGGFPGGTGIVAAGIGGDGGDVLIAARQDVNLDNRIVLTSSDTSAAGNITLLAGRSINSKVGALLATGQGGGDINLTSFNGDITLDDSFLGSYVAGSGQAGAVTLNGNNISLRNASVVANATAGNVTGGPITVNADQILNLTDSGTTRSISLSNLQGVGLPPGLVPSLPAGTIPPGTGITANTIFGPAGGGDIVINAAQLQVQNQSPIGSENRAGITTATITNSTGNAGNIQVNAETVELIGNNPASFTLQQEGSGLRDRLGQIVDIPTGITSSTNGLGDSGTVTVNTNQLSIRDSAAITSGNSFDGQAGDGNDISINAAGAVDLRDSAVIGSGTVGSGNAGNVLIETPTLTLNGVAVIAADTFGTGTAGDVVVSADQIRVLNGARIGASTNAAGNAGSLRVSGINGNASASRIEIDGLSAESTVPSRLFFSSTGGDSTGNAGELRIDAQNLIVQNGGEIAGDTENFGTGGLLLMRTDNIQVRGPGSRISFESRGVGDARGIEIETTGQLFVSNQGEIAVSGEGTGTSGNLNITAGSIFLDQQGRLSATSRASQGGNIRFSVLGDILMRNDGNPTEATEISAQAFGNAIGGNIAFDVDGSILSVLGNDVDGFVRITTEANNDVLAAAEFGRGGEISSKDPQRIFGFREFQGVITPESDFTAIATEPEGIPGTVSVETVEPPAQEPLPDDFAGNDIAQGCLAAAVPVNSPNPQSSFVVVGRGGLPRQPVTTQDTDALIIGLVDSIEVGKLPSKDAPTTGSNIHLEESGQHPVNPCLNQ